MSELRDIYLHGALGRRFGRRFRLAVSTPADAVRALCCQLDGFREAIRDGVWRVIAGPRMARRACDEEQCSAGFSRSLHLVPVIAGAGGGRGAGLGLTIAGAALVALAFTTAFLAPPLGAASLFGVVSAKTFGLVGAALALQGVSILLAPKPKADEPNDRKMDSFLFGGAPDRPVAGRPVPVSFGTFRVTCVPISVQIKNVRLAHQRARQGA